MPRADNTITASPDGQGRRPGVVTRPTLILGLSCDAPLAPSSCHSLVNIDEVTIGRGDKRRVWRGVVDGKSRVNIELPDGLMSRMHARLERPSGRWLLVDGPSKNGCYRNGERVVRTHLADGDLVELGSTLFLYHQAFPWREGGPPDVVADAVAGPAPDMATFQPELAAAYQQLADVARGDMTILIRGETGTGKELAARAIHALSGRSGPIVPINCAALPENIAEAELFGYRRGAFSGASEDQQGLVRSAEGGTLFLDEIGDLRRGVQGVLLRTLQDREVRPLGGLKSVRVDVRFVAATNRDLDDETAFRADLLARLSGYSFTLPPLRARRADVGILVAAILARRVGPEPPAFTTAAARRLYWHDWPHNIRELEQAVTTACKLAAERGDAVGVADLPAAVRGAQAQPAPGAKVDERREELCAALEQHAGNVTRTAESLGITRMQVHRLARRHGIDLAAFRRV